LPTADRLEQAEQMFSAGNTIGALTLLRGERIAAGAHRDIPTLRRIVAMARRIESESPGSAAGHLYAAQSDLSYAESQEGVPRASLAEARASAEAGNDRAASVALEKALKKELEKWPHQRDRDLLDEISGAASTIALRAGGRSKRRLVRVVEDARLALATGPPPRTVHPESVARPVTASGVAPGGVLQERLEGVEERIRRLESELAELRERDIPELRALAAGGELVTEPKLEAQPVRRPVPSAVPAVPAAPPPPPTLPSRPPPAPPREPRLPRFTLSQLQEPRALAWAGGVVTLLGIVFLLVLATDRGWVSAELRVVFGALVSVAVYGAGVVADRRYGRTWAALAAAGAGIGGAYVTIAAAAAVYDFLTKPEALVAAAFVAVVGVGTALVWDTQTTAALGLVGAMVGPAIVEGDVSTVGSVYVAIVLGATVVVTLWRRWLETLVAGALTSLPLAAALLFEHDVGHNTSTAAIVAAFSLIFLGAGVGHEIRPTRPRHGAELVPLVGTGLVIVGGLLALGLALQIDGDSPTGVAVATVTVWLVSVATACAYQVGVGRPGLQRVPTALLTAGVPLAFASMLRFFTGHDESFALLAVALVYLAGLPLLRGRGQRDLACALWAIALTFIAVGVGTLLSGGALTLVWAAEAALLALLASRTGEVRLHLAALAYLVLALGQALVFEAPPSELFVVNDNPGEGVLALLYVAAAALVSGLLYSPPSGPGPRSSGTRLPYPPRRPVAMVACAVSAALLLYAASLSILWLSIAAMAGGQTSTEEAFERGHAAIGSLWALVAFALVFLGLRRPSPVLRLAGIALFGLTILELVAYDLLELSTTNASFAALAVGVLVLAAGFDQGRRSSAEIGEVHTDPVALVFIAVSLALLVPAIVGLLDGQSWGLDRQGLGLLTAAATYGALAAYTLREKRDLSTALWVPALALAAVAAEELLGDPWLVLAWSLAGAALAALALRVREERFSIASGGFIALALLYVISSEVPPSDLFVATARPAAGLASLIFATLGAYAFAAHLEPGELREIAWWAAGVLTLYAASVAILGLFQWFAADDAKSVDDAFQRGQTAMSSFWAIVGLALLFTGLRKGWRDVRIGGLALFAVALVKIFVYDLANLSALARAFSFLGVGLVLLLAAFLYQRLTRTEDQDVPPVRQEKS
jgi:uncharacterized membrane protein